VPTRRPAGEHSCTGGRPADSLERSVIAGRLEPELHEPDATRTRCGPFDAARGGDVDHDPDGEPGASVTRRARAATVGPVEIERTEAAARLLDRAGPLLGADEARNNLALGILSTALARPEAYPDVRGWVVRDGTRVVAAALRTPPHNLVLAAPLRADALGVLTEAIEEDLPGVVGAVPEVDEFARTWARRRGLSVAVRFEQRIYALREPRPLPPTDGAFRLAEASDRELIVDWLAAFGVEALAVGPDTDAERLLSTIGGRLSASDSGFGLWEVDRVPVSLAGFGGTTPTGIRIGPVYTPPVHRGRGYGTAVTAAVSALNLDRGRRVCFLYTDLANPTSNAIYLSIGYEPVCDSRELAFRS
jgi:predicted GNAT family acetyltransferase